MTAQNITLQDYELAERVVAHHAARGGLIAHSIASVLVSAVLVAINLALANEFPWSAFAVVGMTIGVTTHWWFGYHNLDAELTARQHKTEERAAHPH